MPTYSFRNTEPIEDIIEAQGKFGPDLMYQASCIVEAVNVFGSVEWPLFMRATPAQATKQLENNPFYNHFGVVWCLESSTPPTPPRVLSPLGSVAAVVMARQACRAILRAKYGQKTEQYVEEAEDLAGFNYWYEHFWTENGLDRDALLDAVDYWLSGGGGP